MMKRIIKIFLLVALAAAAVYYGAGMYSKVDRDYWPENFQKSGEAVLAPGVVTEPTRDFGWRTGDIVPADFYVKQKPGTIVDTYSLSMEGNFSVLGLPEYRYKTLEDGTKLIHIRVNLQSMGIGDKLTQKTYMLYRDLETNKDHLFELPDFTIYRTDTWDGRDIVKEGDTSLDDWYLMTSNLLMIAGAVIGFVSLLLLNSYFKKAFFVPFLPADFLSRSKKARGRFDAAYEKIISGDYDEENFLELARTVRELFHLQTAGYGEIINQLGEGHPFRKPVTKILLLLGETMYSNKVLTLAEVQEIKANFDKIVPPGK